MSERSIRVEPESVRVACPWCGEPVAVPAPEEGVELKVRSSVAAFGDHETATCEAGHPFWVYYC